MKRYPIVAAAALLAIGGFARPAHAVFLVDTATNSAPYPSIVVDGETFTEVSCTLTLCGGLQMLQDGTNVGVTISSQTNGGSIISGTFPVGADLSLILSVSGAALINQVGLAVTGNNGGSSANNTAAGFGETINTTPGTTGGVTLASTGETWLNLPAGYTSLDLSKDIYVHGPQVTGGDTVSVNTVTQDLAFVPEPASLAVLLSGLAAVAARRARRRL